MKINPTKLLIQDIVETVKETKSGIILPENVKVDSTKGTVVFVGSGTADIEIPYVIGDTVVFHPKAGREFHMDDKKYRLVDVGEILLGGI